MKLMFQISFAVFIIFISAITVIDYLGRFTLEKPKIKNSFPSNINEPSPIIKKDLNLEILPSITISPTPTLKPTIKPESKKTSSDPDYQLTPCDGGKQGCYTIKSAPFEQMASESELNSAINVYRSSHGLNQLQIDPQICSLADQRANEIAGNFSHDGFRSHVENGDYNHIGFQKIAENLWQGSFSAVHIVEFGWDKSPGHQANLKGDFSRGCSGIFNDNAVYIFVK